ncbi:MAG TPA: hypothetical protein ENN07_02735 [candidate division Zixibacteria bacterium]|nr:hypothetical protein [candidate division Zixibacteria bacterium]
MKNKISIAMLIMLGALICMAWPTGGPYELRWGAHTNGGTESEPRASAGGSYLLTDNLGNASWVTDSFLTDEVAYIHRPGYRKVEWDERPPFTSVDDLGDDTISGAPNFIITWGGADTTAEDGIGWGIRFYDVRYRKGPGGTWEDWLTNTSMTSAMFGPFAPEAVEEDTVYYFMCRAHDKAGNVEPWPDDYQAWAKYNEQTLEWVVVNYDGGNIWAIADSVSLNETVTADSANKFIVKNTGTEVIDIGVKGYPATGWSLGMNRGTDRYALRAYFDDEILPPIIFSQSDAVLDTGFTWATGADTDPDTLFGPGGFAIQDASADSVLRTENLWLQLHTPTEVSTWIFDQIIRIDLKARVTTP